MVLKRLIRKADNELPSEVETLVTTEQQTVNVNTMFYANTLNGLAKEGREVLKMIEDYKFKLNQSANMFNGNKSLLNKLEQKEKILDNASGQIYSIIFDLENIDIMPEYEMSQLSMGPTFKPPAAEKNNEESIDNDETLDEELPEEEEKNSEEEETEEIDEELPEEEEEKPEEENEKEDEEE